MSKLKQDDLPDIYRELAKQAFRFTQLEATGRQPTEYEIEDMLQKYWNNSVALSVILESPFLPIFARSVILRRKKNLDQRSDLIKFIVIGSIIAIFVFITNYK